MKRFSKASSLSAVLTLVMLLIAPSRASAFLLGATIVVPGSSVTPGDTTGDAAGTLLAELSTPFTTNLGTTSGTLLTAVYRDSTGFLDFYYQIVNSGGSTDGIARETDTNFTGFVTAVAFRTDGASLPSSPFTNGNLLLSPATTDRGSAGDAVGFNFPLPINEVPPGQTSLVFVISTNATNFTTGNMSVIDGGVFSTPAFQPTTIPEPTSIALLVVGSVIFGSVHPRIFR